MNARLRSILLMTWALLPLPWAGAAADALPESMELVYEVTLGVAELGSLISKLERRGDGFEVTAETRVDRLDRGIDALIRYGEQLAEAVNADFSCRPRQITMLTDIGASIAPMKHAKKHLRKWMKGEKRPTLFPLNLLGGRSRIEYQPLGAVGIISPWNFPVSMVFAPMSGALAAGNRVMIKPSEFTPATSEVLKTLIEDAYDAREVAIFTGGPEVGQAFSNLALDHLLFTGATSVARHIMAAAARNLVPVTLELGGKSPVIISRSADIQQSLGRIMMGKTLNAGQICLAPDYLLVPEEKLHEVIAAAQAAVTAMYPKLLDLSLIHISEPTRLGMLSRMPSSA